VPDHAYTGGHHHHHTPAGGTAPTGPATGGNNGTCQSVRIHGQWVQRCHFVQ
jgi:hypothetical protein